MEPPLPTLADLARLIRDPLVGDLLQRFGGALAHVHESIRVEAGRAEVRFFAADVLLCRIVPYRELFHVQVGEDPSWETRVRSEAGYVEALDRVLRQFLDVYVLNHTAARGIDLSKQSPPRYF